MLSAGHVYTTTLQSVRGLFTKTVQKRSAALIADGPSHSLLPKASQRPLFRLHLTRHYATALSSDEEQTLISSDNEHLGDQDLQASSVCRVESLPTSIKHDFRQSNLKNDGKTKKRRLQAQKLDVHRSEKDFRNQRLKDQAGSSWSHDWREPLRILEQHWIPEADQLPDGSPKVDDHPKIHISRNIRADTIQRPAVWTRVSFYKYVVQVTSSTVDRLVARQLYSKAESHVDAVADVLEDLFADSKMKYLFSTDAADCALKFFFKVGKYARGRDLFSRLQELQKNTSPSTYNILLEAAADQKDLFNFTMILKMMVSHNVYPNAYTWLHLARAVQSDDVRIKVVNELIQKTPTHHPAILRSAVAITFPLMVSKPLESGKDPQSLLEILDSRFGSEWISGPVCQYIIEEVGARHSPEQAVIILKRFSSQGYRPRQGMLLLLLRQCSWAREHELAIDILRLFRTEYGIRPSKRIYDVLFEQAWRSRLYNCCRALWIHACVVGHTSFNMQQKVKRSLCIDRNLNIAAQPRSSFWEQSAGKVIVGCDRPNSEAMFWRLMSIWKPANQNRNERDQFLRAVRAIFDYDLAAVGQFRMPEPLDELLLEALRADRRWATGRALKEVPTECKYSQIIDVGLSRRSTRQISDDQRQSAESVVNAAGAAVEVSSRVSDLCWMSSDMRLRPCRCPAYVKEGLLAREIQSPDRQRQTDVKLHARQ
ncbi:MAG: hypothetical protein Q9216_007142 [Gyalolechia sp. 2 TL-2023]